MRGPRGIPPFAKNAKDGAPAMLVLESVERAEGRAARLRSTASFFRWVNLDLNGVSRFKFEKEDDRIAFEMMFNS